MLSRGQLTNRQLRCALELQSHTGRRLGACLEKLGYASEQQITAALGLQWSCPVLTPGDNTGWNAAQLLPYRLLETFRILPLQFIGATRTFYMAFSDGIDYRVLYAIERMLDCRTEACLVAESAMDRALEQIASQRRSSDFLFEGWRLAPEMARITCSYVLKLGARDVRVVACGGLIWARLVAGHETAHLFFRQPLEVMGKPPQTSSPTLVSRETG